MTKQEAIRSLYGLIADINAEEVADHIKSGVSLCDWTNAWRCEAKDALRVLEDTADTPQTETEIAKAIVHKMIDDAVIAEDAYPDLRQKMHDAVDEYEPQTDCAWR